MAWYNPATWTPVDNLQGQNRKTSSGLTGDISKYSIVPTPSVPISTFNDAAASGGITYDNPAENPNTADFFGGGGSGSWGGSTTANITPVAPPPPVYRDAYGNVRSSQADVDRVNNLGASTRTSMDNLRDTNNRSWSNTQNEYTTRGNTLYDNSFGSQQTINNNRASNALNLRRSMASIANGVRQGLRSGGVNLANMNALDSGAAEAMARAFAKVGTGQVGDARNDAAAQNRILDIDQTNLANSMRTGLENLQNYGKGQVGDLASAWGQNLNVLRTGADAEGIGNIVDTAQDDVWADAATKWLLEQDAGLQGRMNGVKAWGQDQIDRTAYDWDMAGREGANPFASLGFSQGQQVGGGDGSGAPIAQLPIYTRREEQRLV